MGKILKHIENTNPSCDYKIGISDESDDIETVLEYIDESFIALRMSAEKKMIHFSDLGIVGVLINSKNINGIKKIAKQELGPLYNLSDAKMYELIKTLYVFLANGGKLQKTMDDLSLSMSGLMYRINKIGKTPKKGFAGFISKLPAFINFRLTDRFRRAKNIIILITFDPGKTYTNCKNI